MLLIFTVSRNLAELGAGLLVMGLVGAGHAFLASLSSFICGNLSDRVGRVQLILPGMLLLWVSATVCLLVPFGKGLFLSMYWLSAISLGMIHPATIAWINKSEMKNSFSRGVSRNLIRFCVAWNLGVLSSQLSGGWLFLLGPKTPLALSSTIALLNLIVLFLVRKKFNEEPSSEIGPSGKELPQASSPDIQSKTFVQLSWLANLGGAFSVSMILHLFPQLAVSLGVPSNQHGTILAIMRITVICVYLILHHTRFWQYRYASTLTVQATAVVGLLILYFAQNPSSLYIGVLGLALLIGFDYFSGIYYSNTGNEDKKRGFASGMHEASLGLGIAAGSLSGGIAGNFLGDRIPYLLAVIVIGCLTVLQVRLFVKRRKNWKKTTAS
jgi:MFS family permease